MSDAPDVAPDPAPAAEAPAAEPAPEPVAEAAPEPAADPDVFDSDLPDGQVFDRGYVERLRKEGARYRTEAKATQEKLDRYDSVFGVYEQADQDVWLGIAQEWARDPVQAAEYMQEIANNVLNAGGTPEQAAEAVEQAADAVEQTTGLTEDRVQEMIQAQAEKAAADEKMQRDVEAIYDKMREAGIDPKTRDGFSVLWSATNEMNSDIDAAIEKFKADRQAIIDDYVAGRTNGAHPTPAPDTGTAGSPNVEINSMEDARKAADAFIRSRLGR